jgi:Zn-dependent protease
MRHARVRFSSIERIDLLKAWLATSVAFGIFFLGAGNLTKTSFLGFISIISLAAVTAGLGFVGHELMHKFTANRFGVEAEFRSNDVMLVVSILFAFLGFIFAAPGAVHILGSITRRENGLISAAGPAANMVLALLFMPLACFGDTLAGVIGRIGLFVNAMLGVFNMIPVWNLDGTKILAWNKAAYFGMIAAGGALLALAFML